MFDNRIEILMGICIALIVILLGLKWLNYSIQEAKEQDLSKAAVTEQQQKNSTPEINMAEIKATPHE
jgi:H+/gluconate symporter-like permease